MLHVWKIPSVVALRACGDCEDLALFMQYHLDKLGYENDIYLCYEKKYCLYIPMHFIVIYKLKSNRYVVFSNTKPIALLIGKENLDNFILNGYGDYVLIEKFNRDRYENYLKLEESICSE
jgi:predicted transglutaminase-like cysteine proteinase